MLRLKAVRQWGNWQLSGKMFGRKIKWTLLFDDEKTLHDLLSYQNTHVLRNMFGEVLLIKCDGEIAAFKNRCPHQNKPLDNCELSDGYIICPFHRYGFSCKDGKGQGMYIDKYPLKYEDGKVYIGKESWSLF